jgi:predicted ABC-type ATPase
MPQLWVIAGPNGAGKSTLTAKYLEGRLEIINPDLIARELDPSDPNGTRVRLQAGREAIRRQEACLASDQDFSFETTLSGHRELTVLYRAKEAGFKVNLVYVGIHSPRATMGRIRERVASGGHDIPPPDVVRRYERSLANLPRALELVDRAFILDNSGRGYRMLLSVERGRVRHVSANLPAWARNALPREMQRSRGMER